MHDGVMTHKKKLHARRVKRSMIMTPETSRWPSAKSCTHFLEKALEPDPNRTRHEIKIWAASKIRIEGRVGGIGACRVSHFGLMNAEYAFSRRKRVYTRRQAQLSSRECTSLIVGILWWGDPFWTSARMHRPCYPQVENHVKYEVQTRKSQISQLLGVCCYT
jgi:hypothetical protein